MPQKSLIKIIYAVDAAMPLTVIFTLKVCAFSFGVFATRYRNGNCAGAANPQGGPPTEKQMRTPRRQKSAWCSRLLQVAGQSHPAADHDKIVNLKFLDP